MKVEVKTITKEDVKPSSPTPPHLRILKFSILDQLILAPYAPMILFYPASKNDRMVLAEKLNVLKRSLSETLTTFYPLAGRIRDEFSIDCNHEGAYYVETRVTCRLNAFLSQPDVLFLNKFLPVPFVAEESMAGMHVANIQVNVFECGGIAIAVCISHKILDGAALGNFIQCWSATARGCKEAAVAPDFKIASSLFPANDLWLRDSSLALLGSQLKSGRFTTRRFVFDSIAIAMVKDQVNRSGVKCTTRVEAITALLWKSFIAASEEVKGYKSNSVLTHLVNLRSRYDTDELINSTGNVLWLASAKHATDSKPDINNLVSEVRKAISKIDSGFVDELKSEEKMKSIMSESIEGSASDREADSYGFSSWCKLGFYSGSDFGWGKPAWVTSIGLSSPAFMNLVVLVDTRCGEGIEAWVTLDESEMQVLTKNNELLKFASLDPSPLLIG